MPDLQPPSSSKTSDEILIIGGGVIGLSLAWELANRNRRVALLEGGRVAKGFAGASSWAGAGLLPPAPTRHLVDPLDSLKSLSQGFHAEWHNRLLDATGIDSGFRQCGGIYIALTPGEQATLLAGEGWWEEHGIEYTRLPPQALRELEPRLFDAPAQPNREDIRCAWHLPGESQVRNPRLLQALHRACQLSGVRIQENAVVAKLLRDSQGAICGALTESGAEFLAEQTCLCSGAWTRKLLEEIDTASGIMPVRGQIIQYQFAEPPIHRILNVGNRYMVARPSGELLCGSIEEEVGYEVTTTPAAIEEIRGWAESVLPILRTQPIQRSWAGLRPGSFDGLPYLGKVPQYENLFLGAGHFRNGIQLACGTALCLADLMCTGESRLDLSPFRLARG